jgi:hypothetical protein
LTKGNIELTPRFQRRDAWSRQRKSRFIESVALGLPIPQIVLAEARGKKGHFIVLDGKQRLLTLLQFWGNAPESDNNAFKLTELELLPSLKGQTYQDIAADNQTLASLQNAPIRTAIVRDWKSEEYLHRVFLRLNTGSLPLSPQELRLALTPGPFSEYIDDQASSDANLRKLLGLDGPDARMRDVELSVRFLAFQSFLGDYSGRLKPFLDDSYRRLNSEWTARRTDVERLVKQFSEGIGTLIDVFGDEVARKKGSRQFNRALFDALIFYFAASSTRSAALKYKTQVKAEFRKLLSQKDFVAAIERDTAGIPNTAYRLQAWGEALRKACKGTSIPVPREKAGRLIL